MSAADHQESGPDPAPDARPGPADRADGWAMHWPTRSSPRSPAPPAQARCSTFGPDPRNKPTAKGHRREVQRQETSIREALHRLYTYRCDAGLVAGGEEGRHHRSEESNGHDQGRRLDTVIGKLEFDCQGRHQASFDYVVYKWTTKGRANNRDQSEGLISLRHLKAPPSNAPARRGVFLGHFRKKAPPRSSSAATVAAICLRRLDRTQQFSRAKRLSADK